MVAVPAWGGGGKQARKQIQRKILISWSRCTCGQKEAEFGYPGAGTRPTRKTRIVGMRVVDVAVSLPSSPEVLAVTVVVEVDWPVVHPTGEMRENISHKQRNFRRSVKSAHVVTL
jgi:hypothetical protein